MNIHDFARNEAANKLPASKKDAEAICFSYLTGINWMKASTVQALMEALWEQHGETLLHFAKDLRSGDTTSREIGERLSHMIATDQILHSAHLNGVFTWHFQRITTGIRDRIRFVQASAEDRRAICMDRARKFIEQSTQSASMTRQLLIYLVEHADEEVTDETLKQVISKNTYRRSSTQPKVVLQNWRGNFSPSMLTIERVRGTGFVMKFTLYPDLQNKHFDSVEQPVAAVEQPVAAVEQPVAAVEQPVAAVEQPVAAVEQPVAAVEQPVAAVEPLLVPFVLDPLKQVMTQQRSREWASRHFLPHEADVKILAHYCIQSFGKVITDADIKAFENDKQKTAPAMHLVDKLHILADLRRKHMDVPFVIVVVKGGYQMIPVEMVRSLASHGKSIFPPVPEKLAAPIDPENQRAINWVQNYPFHHSDNVLRKVFIHLAQKFPQKLSLVQVASDLGLSYDDILATVVAYEKRTKNKRFDQDFRLDHDVDTISKGKPHFVQLLKG